MYRRTCGGLGHDVVAGHPGRAAVRAQQRRQDAHRGRLARAVRARACRGSSRASTSRSRPSSALVPPYVFSRPAGLDGEGLAHQIPPPVRCTMYCLVHRTSTVRCTRVKQLDRGTGRMDAGRPMTCGRPSVRRRSSASSPRQEQAGQRAGRPRRAARWQAGAAATAGLAAASGHGRGPRRSGRVDQRGRTARARQGSSLSRERDRRRGDRVADARAPRRSACGGSPRCCGPARCRCTGTWPSKEHLLDLMLDALIAEMEVPGSDRGLAAGPAGCGAQPAQGAAAAPVGDRLHRRPAAAGPEHAAQPRQVAGRAGQPASSTPPPR